MILGTNNLRTEHVCKIFVINILGAVKGSMIRLKHQKKGHIFEFIPSDTVGKLIGEVEETTGSSCVIKDIGLYNKKLTRISSQIA